MVSFGTERAVSKNLRLSLPHPEQHLLVEAKTTDTSSASVQVASYRASTKVCPHCRKSMPRELVEFCVRIQAFEHQIQDDD
jgi:hypothetical protein